MVVPPQLLWANAEHDEEVGGTPLCKIRQQMVTDASVQLQNGKLSVANTDLDTHPPHPCSLRRRYHQNIFMHPQTPDLRQRNSRVLR